MRKVRWEEMLPDKLLAAIREKPVCYLVFGLAKPHSDEAPPDNRPLHRVRDAQTER